MIILGSKLDRENSRGQEGLTDQETEGSGDPKALGRKRAEREGVSKLTEMVLMGEQDPWLKMSLTEQLK